MIRVVVADDQPLARLGLAALLGTEPDITVVGTATDGEEAVAQARALRPDVVCMDIRMPGRDGISATRELSGPGSTDAVPVLILTTFDLDDYVSGRWRRGRRGSSSRMPTPRWSSRRCARSPRARARSTTP
ncbi:response regulator [Mobilicoccus caccae]|uniref:Response regulatory domain-containing protein n=1 Tax=Mobilicoccus caccae TaxID=1859295 RepID=A0ABQ6IPD0_9MICO|nr:hypothetical protein GCM10025883_12250 [Mobilicoccus caccae]